MLRRRHIFPVLYIAAALSAVLAVPATLSAQSAPRAGAGATRPEIVLAPKGQMLLPFKGTPVRIAVADPEVADVTLLASGAGGAEAVMLTGKKAGTTQVQVWSAGSQSPQVWNVRVAGAIQQAMQDRGAGGDFNVDVLDGQALISGQAPSALAHRNAVEAASAAVGGDKSVVDTSTVAPGGVVQVEVKVVELSSSVMKQVGISLAGGSSGPWRGSTSTTPDGFSAPLFDSANALASGFSLFYDTRNFNAGLRLLQTNGMARVLAEPTLVALTGQSASFLAGGEIPIPEAGGLGTQSVVFKPFGIGLTVTPTILSRDRIALKVAPEASELDFTNGLPVVNGDTTTLIPALRTRRADTTVELGDGESFVISGLVSRQTKASVNKIPLLGDLPIIGSFFRGVDYSQEDSELIIIVTPRLVRPIARGVAVPLPGGRQEVSDTGINAWGYYLLGPASGQQMPGFSR